MKVELVARLHTSILLQTTHLEAISIMLVMLILHEVLLVDSYTVEETTLEAVEGIAKQMEHDEDPLADASQK